jgi:Asp-tRNA(Asn)/Glu-tRNA(Gln) amidotransferase A subunit family amidase
MAMPIRSHSTAASVPRGAALSLLFAVSVALLGCGKQAETPATAAQLPGPFRLEEATITDIQNAILSKQVTTVQVVEGYLRRIKAYNGTCVSQPNGLLGTVMTIPNAGQINALSTLNLRPASRNAWGFDERKARSMTDATDNDPNMPDALEIAAAQDAAFAKTGKLVGPLHGVVMSFKDQYDTFDMRSTSGADAAYANDRPPDDATFISRLRAAGVIVLAKANAAEYADGGARSSFGGVFCNPYNTERSPSNSSAGSGSSVAANLVTCAMAEETGSSVRGPARANNAVGIAPTQELISRDGMIQPGINTRVGPICRTVEDTARILDAYAGYDPKDELTVYSIGRKPADPYFAYAKQERLEGVRIGVVRELMNRTELGDASNQTIDLVEQAVADLRKLGAEIVDPGAGGALLAQCTRKYAPKLGNILVANKYPELFPKDKDGKPKGDQVTTLLGMVMDPAKVPEIFSFMELPRGAAIGEGRFMMNLYLAQRGDANIKTNTDLMNKANFHKDDNYPDRKAQREEDEKDMYVDMSDRMLDRFMVQTTILQCMEEMKLDAMAYPTANTPPEMLGSPTGAGGGGRSRGSSSSLGRQGFPAITVPAGFTTEVWDRVRDPSAPKAANGQPGTKLVGPVAARVPVGIDFVARPFAEPTLFKIASAYEHATKHRTPPPGFGPLEGEP